MKVLIAGASGYVGRYLTWILEKDHDLKLADRVEPDDTRLPWTYQALELERKAEHTPKPSPSLPFNRGDILDDDYCKRITEGVEVAVVLSASVDHNNPTECFRTNAVGTFNMLEACAQNGVSRVLVASSINALGWFHCRITDRERHWPYLPVDDAYPTDHEDAYSLSKYCNDLNCVAWTNRTGMTTGSFRFSGVFPPEWTETQEQRAKPTEAWHETLAEYVDLRDVAMGLKQAIECPTLPKSGAYLLSAPDTQLPEPTMEIIERFRPELLKVLRKELPGRTSFIDCTAAREAFGYAPQHHWKAI